jgi:hypothetical protein
MHRHGTERGREERDGERERSPASHSYIVVHPLVFESGEVRANGQARDWSEKVLGAKNDRLNLNTAHLVHEAGGEGLTLLPSSSSILLHTSLREANQVSNR